MDEKKIADEIMDKFIKNFPIEFTALRGENTNNYHDIDLFHSYACHIAIDCFDFHRNEQKQEMPSLFLIPFERKLVSERGAKFINMGKEAGALSDDKPDSKYAVAYIGCKFTNNLSKNMGTKVIGGLLDDLNAKYYAFVSEAWCVKSKQDTEKNIPIKELDITPSEHPDREEILMVNTVDINNTNIITTKPIRNGILIHSEGNRSEQKVDNDYKHHGRFSNLFNEIRAESKPN
tara:strand:+ start:624 stop:1322 length:699 start_codon:yes stop_codon:yes gene_type:complete